MNRRVYKFVLKTLKEVSFVGTQYFPVEIDPSLSPYTTVLATIWDEDQMVGQVNQTEILAWWSEAYHDPKQESFAGGEVLKSETPAASTAPAANRIMLAEST